jgi:hypothetical protein
MMEKILHEDNHEVFQYRDFKCVMRRNMTTGSWCGYVGIPTNHPLFDSKDLDQFNVHGGITWSNFIPEEGDTLYYIGFDCCHAYDIMPFMYMQLSISYQRICEDQNQTYKDAEYVRKEIRGLVDQIISVNEKEKS